MCIVHYVTVMMIIIFICIFNPMSQKVMKYQIIVKQIIGKIN